MVPLNNLGPDLSGKVVNETQYRENPKESYLIAVKRIFRYLKGTPSLGLWYPKCSGFDLKGYSDSDYAGCNMDKKSTSSASVVGCCANILWMKSQLTDYDIIYEKVPIFCDNTSAIAISNNLVLHTRTKHIDIRYHFIRDHILKGDIELHFIPTQYQLADIFTKPLDEPTFKRLIVELAESSSHNPSSPEITPKEELVTLDKPESPNPYLPTNQIEFTFEEIAFTTNNEVALLYPPHPNSEYFREVSDFISKCGIRGDIGIDTFRNALRAHYLPHSIVRPWFATIGYSGEIRAKGTLKKSCLPPRWRLPMGQIIQCLGGKTGGLDQISNKDATILYCFANGVKVDYAKLIWKDIIHKLSKKTREKVVPYPRFISLLLEYMMLEYDNEELTINPTQVFSVHNWALRARGERFKAPKPSSKTKEVPQGKNPGAKSGLRRKQSSKHTSESKTKASKSKTSQSEKETQSSSAKDKSPSHPSPPTLVVGEMHKEAQQAAGGSTSLGATSEEGAYPQLNSGTNPSILVDQTKSAKDGLKTAHIDSSINKESRADDISNKIKLQDLSNLLKDTRSAIFTPYSPQDEPIIVSDESEEEEELTKDKDTHASFHDVPEDTSILHPPSPKLTQIQELMAQLTDLLVTSLKPEFSKLLASHDFASGLPNALKELPSKFTDTSGEIKALKKHVQDMKIELPGDLKEIPTKLETFTSTISSLSS
ncbi:hypothetical protein Tco_0271871 [Tanacetum coccineum]